MIRGKKGNIFFGFVVALVVYIFGILFIPFITNDITTSQTALDCTNISISAGSKLVCLNTDLVIPYVIWLIISIALGYLAGGARR
ncbi:MAG TPA: hypothetical protein ENG87_00495 [Candidatus Pacearchaeota archaeon]|nr:hypothetical protein BMS3Abin17_00087 [archaeon BMS3Abin17]HDK41827.1 hypothetical protein [Candidatus Pacearchaeota archaeon]HDZ60165.1 hypothetical protein [Candidatus Pacearchaeota archaeon]